MQMLQIPELKEMEIRPEEFSNCISLIMSSTEYRACTINLRGEEALVLINMINHVCDFFIIIPVNPNDSTVLGILSA